MRAQESQYFFIPFPPQLLFCYLFNSCNSAVSEAVVHSIRKNYIRISWKWGCWGKRGSALHHSPTQEEASTATVLQHHHNILHCHNITAKGEVSVGGIFRVQRCWEGENCSVSDPPSCQLSVKGDELGLCAAGHDLGSLRLLLWRQLMLGLLLLLLLLWATRRSHLGAHKVSPTFSLVNQA